MVIVRIVVLMVIFNGFFLISDNIFVMRGLNNFELIIMLKYRMVNNSMILVGVRFVMF